MQSDSPSKKRKTSSSSSLAVGLLDRRFFWDGSDDVTLDDWIELVKPSLLSSTDCAWIQVKNKKIPSILHTFSELDYQPALDKITQLIEAGKRVPSSAKNECVRSLIATAKRQHCMVGKWMLFVPPSEADETWAKIAKATASGTLGSSAKIAPAKDKGDRNENTVCCIYVENFSCRRNVQRVLRGLFDLGFKVTCGFKPDFYTYLDIYTKNKWRLSPVLYSVKDALSWDDFSNDDNHDNDHDGIQEKVNREDSLIEEQFVKSVIT